MTSGARCGVGAGWPTRRDVGSLLQDALWFRALRSPCINASPATPCPPSSLGTTLPDAARPAASAAYPRCGVVPRASVSLHQRITGNALSPFFTRNHAARRCASGSERCVSTMRRGSAHSGPPASTHHRERLVPLLHSEPRRIERRQKQQRQHGGDDQAAHDGNRHRAPEDAA